MFQRAVFIQGKLTWTKTTSVTVVFHSGRYKFFVA